MKRCRSEVRMLEQIVNKLTSEFQDLNLLEWVDGNQMPFMCSSVYWRSFGW